MPPAGYPADLISNPHDAISSRCHDVPKNLDASCVRPCPCPSVLRANGRFLHPRSNLRQSKYIRVLEQPVGHTLRLPAGPPLHSLLRKKLRPAQLPQPEFLLAFSYQNDLVKILPGTPGKFIDCQVCAIEAEFLSPWKTDFKGPEQPENRYSFGEILGQGSAGQHGFVQFGLCYLGIYE
jgi:hypothetical protein